MPRMSEGGQVPESRGVTRRGKAAEHKAEGKVLPRRVPLSWPRVRSRGAQSMAAQSYDLGRIGLQHEASV